MTPTPQLEHQEYLGFKIWYSDSTFDSTQGEWTDAPDDDVQYVMIYFQKKDALSRYTRLAASGCDYYALDMETKHFTSSFDDVAKVKGHIKYGKFMDLETLLSMSGEFYNDYGEWLTGEPNRTQSIAVPANEEGKGT